MLQTTPICFLHDMQRLLALAAGKAPCMPTAWHILTSDGFAFREFRRSRCCCRSTRQRVCAQQYRNEEFSFWSQVMFTDSKYFTISSSSRRIEHYQLTVEPPSNVPTPTGFAAWAACHGLHRLWLDRDVLVFGGSVKNSRFLQE